jgi:hypothetical protein
MLDRERAEFGPATTITACCSAGRTAGRDAKIDWKAQSSRIRHADVAFIMRQYVQTDLEVDRQGRRLSLS